MPIYVSHWETNTTQRDISRDKLPRLRHHFKRAPSRPHAALVFSLGRGVKRRYGLTIFMSGKISFACSVLTLGWTMTSSPALKSAPVSLRLVKGEEKERANTYPAPS